jgi:hypothetical protein
MEETVNNFNKENKTIFVVDREIWIWYIFVDIQVFKKAICQWLVVSDIWVEKSNFIYSKSIIESSLLTNW